MGQVRCRQQRPHKPGELLIMGQNCQQEQMQLSFFNRTFWNLWLMKVFRNIASVKYQWLLFLYIPTIWGMFNLNEKTGEPWISATLGLGFLGGGFITLATSRLIAQSSLIEDSESNNNINTDK